MNKHERNDVKKTAAGSGMHTSSTNPNKQTDGTNTVTHIGTNRTNVNGNTYYGPTAAKNAIGKLK